MDYAACTRLSPRYPAFSSEAHFCIFAALPEAALMHRL